MKVVSALRLIHGIMSDGPMPVVISALVEASTPGALDRTHVEGDAKAFDRDDYLILGMAGVGISDGGWAYTEFAGTKPDGSSMHARDAGDVIDALPEHAAPSDTRLRRLMRGKRLKAATLAFVSVGRAKGAVSAQVHFHPDLSYEEACGLLKSLRREARAEGMPDAPIDPPPKKGSN